MLHKSTATWNVCTRQLLLISNNVEQVKFVHPFSQQIAAYQIDDIESEQLDTLFCFYASLFLFSSWLYYSFVFFFVLENTECDTPKIKSTLCVCCLTVGEFFSFFVVEILTWRRNLPTIKILCIYTIHIYTYTHNIQNVIRFHQRDYTCLFIWIMIYNCTRTQAHNTHQHKKYIPKNITPCKHDVFV